MHAFVTGSERYRVSVGFSGDAPTYSCTCHMGVRDHFCEHIVAVVCAWIARLDGAETGEVTPPVDDLSNQLRQLSKEEIIQVVSEIASRNDSIERTLRLKFSKDNAVKELDVPSIKKMLRKSFSPGGFVNYYRAPAFARKMFDGLDLLDELFNAGHASVCIDLAEYAMKLADKACLSMDDSDGHMTIIFNRIKELHRLACEAAPPDPERLAERLFAAAKDSSFSQFYDCLETHRNALGSRGRDRFRQLVEETWKKLPIKGPDKAIRGHRIDTSDVDEDRKLGRSIAEYFMKIFAEESGDVDLQVAVLSKNLKYSFSIAQICKILLNAKRYGEVLDWVRRGFELFPDRYDRELVIHALDSYRALGRQSELERLAWSVWSKSNSLESYQQLKKYSEPAGSWTGYREKIFADLRAKLRPQAQSDRGDFRVVDYTPAASAILVSILIWEQEIEEAWQLSQCYGCLSDQLYTLARLRERSHPLDSIGVYKEFVRRETLQANTARMSPRRRELSRSASSMQKLLTHLPLLPTTTRSTTILSGDRSSLRR